MRKFSIFLTVLTTSFVMALAGLVASPIASASENGNGSISATFPLGSSVLSDAQKAAIKKTVASSGSDVSFIVTGTAGKLPGVSDRWVQRLAKKRAQAIKSYLVSLGVSKANVTTQTKTTEIGIVPKSIGSYPTSASTVAVTNSAGTGSGSGSGGGGSTAIAPGAPTGVSATAGNAQSVVSWTAPTVGTAVTSYTVSSTPGITSCIVSSTSCTLTPLTNGTAYTITVTATNSAGTGPASTGISVTPAAPTCATGGTCIVGATGPGGGIVYYVDNAGFNCGPTHSSTGSPTLGLCNYLEVAPSGWNTGSDPSKHWAVTANQGTLVPGIDEQTSVSALNVGLEIGLGYKNSVAIGNQGNDTTTAAGAARAYAGGSKNDWYLPTTAELNLLCQWNRNVTQNVTTACTGGSLDATGSGFASSAYWSSSERGITSAWSQSFNTGSQIANTKPTGGGSGTSLVRPVRAF